MKYLVILLAWLPALACGATLTVIYEQPTKYEDGSSIEVITANTIYRGTRSDGSDLALYKTLPATTQFVDSVTGGQWCYAITATAGRESERAGPVCKVVTVYKTIAVTPRLLHIPVFRIGATGTRSAAVYGFVPVGTECIGAVVFRYRGDSYRRVPVDTIQWWDVTPAGPDVAAACGL